MLFLAVGTLCHICFVVLTIKDPLWHNNWSYLPVETACDIITFVLYLLVSSVTLSSLWEFFVSILNISLESVTYFYFFTIWTICKCLLYLFAILIYWYSVLGFSFISLWQWHQLLFLSPLSAFPSLFFSLLYFCSVGHQF